MTVSNWTANFYLRMWAMECHNLLKKMFWWIWKTFVSNNSVKFSEKTFFGALILPTTFFNVNLQCFVNV